MGKLIYRGSYTSPDDIPQATSIIFGRNLQQGSEKPTKKQNAKPQASRKVKHGALPVNVTGAGKRAWLNYRSRLDRFSDTERKFEAAEKEVTMMDTLQEMYDLAVQEHGPQSRVALAMKQQLEAREANQGGSQRRACSCWANNRFVQRGLC